MPDLLRIRSMTHVGQFEEDGTLIIKCEEIDVPPPRCSAFCSMTRAGHKTTSRYRDFPVQGQPTWLQVSKQKYHCKPCGKSPSRENPDIVSFRRITARFKQGVALAAVKHTFQTAAEINAVDYSLTRRVFLEYAAVRLKGYNPKMPRVLGIDEKNVGGRMRLVIGDIEARAMLDMERSRKENFIRPYFKKFPDRTEVKVVCMDMWRTYKRVSLDLFPNCVVVIDKWHALRMSDWGVEKVRRLIQGELSATDRSLLKRQNRLLMLRFGSKTTTDGQCEQLLALFEKYPSLKFAYWFREGFYNIYDCANREEAEEDLLKWLREVEACPSQPYEMKRVFAQLVTAIGNWRPYMLNYFDHRFTNAYVESLNNCIAKINAAASGLDFKVLRAKALLRYSHLREEPVYKLQKRKQADDPGPLYEGFIRMTSDYERVRVGTRKVHSGVPLSDLEALLAEEAAAMRINPI